MAVRADERDTFGRNVKTATSGKSGFGENFSQTKIELTKLAGRDGLLLANAQNLFVDRGRIVERSVVEEFCVEMRRSAGDARESGVNAVGRGAGH